MTERSESENALIISCMTLRKTIGILGMLLPFVLALGAAMFFQTGIQSSVSYYYHTGMGDVFVGTLCAIGIFLLSYMGYIKGNDHAYGSLAGICAVGMALFPTTLDNPAPGDSTFIGYLHIAFTAVFFLSLIYFSLFLFTKTDETPPLSKPKLWRNRVYRTCGYTMIICLVLIVIYYFLPTQTASSIEAYHPIFWLEAIAIVAFGFSWLTKGEALLKDKPKTPV